MKNYVKNITGPIKAGSIIHTEKPFAFILSSKERTFRCDHCFIKTKVLKCSGCHYVHYCGKICQKEAWGEHKAECVGFKRVLPRVPPDAARLLARLVRKLAYGGAHVRGHYSEKSFRVWKDLMSHYQDIKVDSRRMEHFACLCAILFQLISDISVPNSAELMGIYGRMCINGFTILDPEMLSIGTGIYLGASIIDHSCEPNAVAVFDGTTINIRTLIDLPCLDWSKVFISYIDLLNTPFDRQTELMTTYYFLCQCERCLSQEQISLMHAAQCPNKSCDYPIQIPWRENLKLFIESKTNDQESEKNLDHDKQNGHSYCNGSSNGELSNMNQDFNAMSLVKKNHFNENGYASECPKCGHYIDEEFIAKFKGVMDDTDKDLQYMKEKSTTFVDICRKSLDKQNGVLHPLSLYHVQTLDLAMDGCLQYEFWDQAMQYAKLLLPGFRNYYGEKHPLHGLLYMKLGKLQLFLCNPVEALESLKKAGEILKLTHGENHTLFKDVLTPMIRQAYEEIES